MKSHWMKLRCLLLCCVLLTVCMGSVIASAETAGEWRCGSCGETSAGKFCPNCGSPRPTGNEDQNRDQNQDQDQDKSHLVLSIDFETNLIFSTYDVEVYLNKTKITTMPHGKALKQTFNVKHGVYVLSFNKVGDQSVNGAISFKVDGKTEVQCKIHAKSDKITIDKIQVLDSQGNKVTTDTVAANTIEIGKKAELDGIFATLLSVKESKGSSYNKPDAGNVYVLCEFEIENRTDDDFSVSSLLCFSAYLDDYKYDPSFGAMIEGSNQLDGTIDPGRKLKGTIGFELPKDWDQIEITFTPNVWSNKKITFVANRK